MLWFLIQQFNVNGYGVNQMVKLYYKHLYPSMKEWRDKPFAPWSFKEQVLLNVLSFFESNYLEDEDFDLKRELGCEIFMDSGAFTATAMGFELDPYEVAEMQVILKADIIVPLDKVILANDTSEDVNRKISENIRNTEILLDMNPKGSEIIGPLHGFSKEIIQRSYDSYYNLGIRKFALGGIVFEPDFEKNLERMKLVREITGKHHLHVFGKFLHPELLHYLIEMQIDSVDGYGYIFSSLKGQYIVENKYESLADLTDESIKLCSCRSCQENSLQDFLRGDRDAQHLLIQHNITSLNRLKLKLEKNKGK
jgi:tRNA-guanine family transglycosylase